MKPLVQVGFRHGYFANRLCTCLVANTAGSTHRTMSNHGLWWKQQPGGFILLYDTRHGGGDRSRESLLNNRVALSFHLRLQDPYFYNYTASPSALPGRQVLYFFNHTGTNHLQVTALGYRTTQPSEYPFAILRLRLRPQLEENYDLEFQPRSISWRYILVGSHLQDLHLPAILDGLTRQPFKGPEPVRLTDGRPGIAFMSPASIDCRERPMATCMLVENFDPASGRHKVVMPYLPVPDVRLVSAATGIPDPNTAEILIY